MGNYATVADIKAEGAPASASSVRIEARIAKWEKIVEQITGNIFRVMEPGELVFNGNNSRIMHFNLPLIEVSSVRTNSQDAPLASTEFTAYTGRTQMQDDRRNPKIMLTPTGTSAIFRTIPGVFANGLNQYITAKWGFVDDGLTPGTYITPVPIKAAIIELVCLDLDSYFESSSKYGHVSKETTDGHSMEYDYSASSQSAYEMVPRRIMDVLGIYRRPWIVDSPQGITALDLMPETYYPMYVSAW